MDERVEFKDLRSQDIRGRGKSFFPNTDSEVANTLLVSCQGQFIVMNASYLNLVRAKEDGE